MYDFMVHWFNVLLSIIILIAGMAVMVFIVGSILALLFWNAPDPRPWWLYLGAFLSFVTIVAILTPGD